MGPTGGIMPTARELLAMPAPDVNDPNYLENRAKVDAAVDQAYADMEIGAQASQKPSSLDYETWTPRRRRRS